MTPSNPILQARFGDFVVDFESFELRKHGIRLRLQDQPFQILRLLLQRPGQLVTREELCSELWADSTFVDFDAGLNAAVRRLRDVLIDSADQPRYIETLPRHGYRFIAPVEVLATGATSIGPKLVPASIIGEVKAAEGCATIVLPELTASPYTYWSIRSLLPACLLLATIMLGAFTLRSRVFATYPVTAGTYSIAVLPLQNLSGDPSQDYFADGMTDALITNLAQSNTLRVISSTSSMRYRDPHKALPDIGRELNVGLILEGSVIRSGNHIRVSAQLVDAENDRHLWARQYDRDLQDVLQLQSELASAVALEVTGKLTSWASRSTTARKVNPQAYEAYLKGEYFLDKWSAEGFEKAKGYFQQSIDFDPSFADAYAGLAEYYGVVAFMGVVPPRDAWLRSEDLLNKALEIDNTSSKAHSLLGMIKMQFRCDPPAAEKELNQALALNPGDMRALDYHSYYLLELGRMDEAIAEKKRILEHDPLRVITNAELGLYLAQAGRLDEAIVQFKKTLELDPSHAAAHMRLGLAYADKREYDKAVPEIQKAIYLDRKPARFAHLGEVYALWGKRRLALKTIAELKQMSKKSYVPAFMVARVYARLGDRAAALNWVKKTKADDGADLSDPGFDSLRSDPQFKVLEATYKPSPSCPRF
jgi:TolB-like protein/DNA-binding winged helix-turn-helix (wHTH) protein/Flp pilus assembly protein TadD